MPVAPDRPVPPYSAVQACPDAILRAGGTGRAAGVPARPAGVLGKDEAVIETATWPPRLTQEDADFLFMMFLENDTKDAPWMVMGDL
jgi:hypothetical protein